MLSALRRLRRGGRRAEHIPEVDAAELVMVGAAAAAATPRAGELAAPAAAMGALWSIVRSPHQPAYGIPKDDSGYLIPQPISHWSHRAGSRDMSGMRRSEMRNGIEPVLQFAGVEGAGPWRKHELELTPLTSHPRPFRDDSPDDQERGDSCLPLAGRECMLLLLPLVSSSASPLSLSPLSSAYQPVHGDPSDLPALPHTTLQKPLLEQANANRRGSWMSLTETVGFAIFRTDTCKGKRRGWDTGGVHSSSYLRQGPAPPT
eukprot:gene13265-biopygen7800